MFVSSFQVIYSLYCRILISEGIYNEALVVEKNLELVGLGDKEQVKTGP
jgi:hypothetical protein